MIDHVPEDVISSVRRIVCLATRVRAGEYGDVPPEDVEAMVGLEAKAKELLAIIMEVQEGIRLLGGVELPPSAEQAFSRLIRDTRRQEALVDYMEQRLINQQWGPKQ